MISVDFYLVALVAVAFLVPWRELGSGVRKRWFGAGLHLLRAYLQRRHRCTIVMLTGAVERHQTCSLVARISRARTDRPLVDAGLACGVVALTTLYLRVDRRMPHEVLSARPLLPPGRCRV